MADHHETDDIALPALMRSARGTYSRAIKAELADLGLDDLPRSGPFVLGGMANHGGTAQGMLLGLGVSKQAASQLVDTLVVRGYLDRRADPEDRRRVQLELTDRGRAAAAGVRSAIRSVDAALAKRITADQLHGLRAGLLALSDLGAEQRGER